MNIDVKNLNQNISKPSPPGQFGKICSMKSTFILRPDNHSSGNLFHKFNCPPIKKIVCTYRVFITSLFVLGKDEGQPKLPMIKILLNKLLYTQTVEYCAAI